MPYDPAFHDARETRLLRDRNDAVAAQIDAAGPPRIAGCDRRLVSVTNLGNMVPQGDHYFACNPVQLNGPPNEGGTATPWIDTGTVMLVDFLRGAPNVGDLAVATAVGGRWVAEKKGGGTKICVQACGGVLVGATITVYDSGGAVLAKCTTDASGCCKVAVTGSYLVTVAVGGTVIYGQTLDLSGTVQIGIGAPGQSVCCGHYLIPFNLTLTTGLGTLPFVYTGQIFQGFSGWYARQIFTPPGNTVIDECAFGASNFCWAALGPGTTVLDYIGFCTDDLGPPYPPGQFHVKLRWGTAPYDPNLVNPSRVCSPGDGTTATWYGLRCAPGANATACAYLGNGDGRQLGNTIFPWNAEANNTAPPTRTVPFAWSGTLVSRGTAEECLVPPYLTVAISA